MVELLNSAWREELEALVAGATHSIIITAPYIKDNEAAWLCERIPFGVEIVCITDVDSRALGASTLDAVALQRFLQASARLYNVQNLHAKVFIADEKMAIITSGNLTTAGLEGNSEYGVLLRDEQLVKRVRMDMLSLARSGRELSLQNVEDLIPAEKVLRTEYANVHSSASSPGRYMFNEAMAQVTKPAHPLTGPTGEAGAIVWAHIQQMGRPFTNREVQDALVDQVPPNTTRWRIWDWREQGLLVCVSQEKPMHFDFADQHGQI